MGSYPSKPWAGKRLFVGIDVHRYQWHITILFEDGLRLFSNNILGCWDSLRELLDKYDTASKILVVYEAGFLGFWLHDLLLAYGADVVGHLAQQDSTCGRRSSKDRQDRQRATGKVSPGGASEARVGARS